MADEKALGGEFSLILEITGMEMYDFYFVLCVVTEGCVRLRWRRGGGVGE
jgi:hypothetical protein